MPELTVVAPTFNERVNVEVLFAGLDRALSGIDFELIVVDDDSPDGTAEAARTLARADRRVRVLQRIGRKGLASAVVEGFMASSSPYLAVIDADMQHDESVLPRMLAELKAGNLDLVIGSRNAAQGSMGKFPSERVALSNLGKRLSRLVCHVEVSDPMSGFFVLTRSFLEEVVHSLSLAGFKILIDILASSPRPVRIAETGYTFRPRVHGRSKLDVLVGLEYLRLLADKLVGGWIPVNYVLYSLMGTIGAIGQMACVFTLLHVFHFAFWNAQATSSVLVIVVNFLLNNSITFRSHKLEGWHLIAGLALYSVSCGVGLVTNVRIADLLRSGHVPWYAASFVGLLIGSVWNYWVTSVFVWRVYRRPRASRRLEARA
jgi:dolichol-phosphate mannosyltransferase